MAKSRYSRNKIIDGKYFESFSLGDFPVSEFSLFDNVPYIEYTVNIGDRLDIIAAKFLNDDKYWWVIALFNGLEFPKVSPGQKIRIPTSVDNVLDKI